MSLEIYAVKSPFESMDFNLQRLENELCIRHIEKDEYYSLVEINQKGRFRDIWRHVIEDCINVGDYGSLTSVDPPIPFDLEKMRNWTSLTFSSDTEIWEESNPKSSELHCRVYKTLTENGELIYRYTNTRGRDQNFYSHMLFGDSRHLNFMYYPYFINTHVPYVLDLSSKFQEKLISKISSTTEEDRNAQINKIILRAKEDTEKCHNKILQRKTEYDLYIQSL